MGSGCSVTCARCDYRATLELGYGMAGLGLTPMHCLDCDELVSVVSGNALDQPDVPMGTCPRCSGRRLLEWLLDEDTLEQSGPRPPLGLCPKCGGPVEISGRFIWD